MAKGFDLRNRKNLPFWGNDEKAEENRKFQEFAWREHYKNKEKVRKTKNTLNKQLEEEKQKEFPNENKIKRLEGQLMGIYKKFL